MTTKVQWRGKTFDKRTRDMLVELQRLNGPIYIHPSQGSYNKGGVSASAGTHDGGGAVDISVRDMNHEQIEETVKNGRVVGFAMWHRKAIPGVWGEHIHGIAIGAPDLPALAKAQIEDYRKGKDGLAGHHSDPDAVLHVTPTTWERYEESKNAPKLATLASGVAPGKHHAQVKVLQAALIKAGYGPIPSAVTDFYGNDTAKAVVRFHEKNPRFASGAHDPVIGPNGFKELQRQAANK